ncbi:mRNA-binding protein [Martiniozyma asiatica (nom. inval.)]|nr:mRNA-binding protein [Martiniozyma asiatica]
MSSTNGKDDGSSPWETQSGNSFASSLLHSLNVGPLAPRDATYAAFEDAVMSEGSDALRDALSAISAPVATKSRFPNVMAQGGSLSGVSLHGSGHGHTLGGSSFMEKFASVTEKTRDLELGKPSSLHHPSSSIGSRRSSAITTDPTSPQQLFREPRKQSFSEKLDSYISATGSPSNSRHLSFSSVVEKVSLSDKAVVEDAMKNIWHPASASTFHPTTAPEPVPTPTAHNPVGYPGFGEYGFMPAPMEMMMPPFIPGPNGGFMPPMFPPQYNSNTNEEQKSQELLKESSNLEEDRNSSENSDAKVSNGADADADADTDADAGAKVAQDNDEGKPEGDESDKGKQFYPSFPMPPFNMFAPPFPMIPSAIGSPPPPMMLPPHMIGMPMNNAQGPKTKTPPANRNNKSPTGPNNLAANANQSGKRNRSPKYKSKHIVRSPMLEDFRANKGERTYTLEIISSHAYEFAKDQHGSRFIQQELSSASDEAKDIFFKEIKDQTMDLMTDVFGNYVIQKYFAHGSDVQRNVLFETMRGSFNNLSYQMYGCRVVQRCLEAVPLENQLLILEELRPNIFHLVKDQNGNHVIQKSIEEIPIDKIPFILENLKHQIYHLSMHPYGCRVIQRLLECSPIADQDYILGELKDYIYYLVQDQFGNYVIQHVIESGNKAYQDEILQVILNNLIELSKHKFASNAVEKCIINLPMESRVKIFYAMMQEPTVDVASASLNPESADSNLLKMMKDPFANYVVQKMVELIDDANREKLVNKICEYLDIIRKGSGGKHLASVEKLGLLCSRYT